MARLRDCGRFLRSGWRGDERRQRTQQQTWTRPRNSYTFNDGFGKQMCHLRLSMQTQSSSDSKKYAGRQRTSRLFSRFARARDLSSTQDATPMSKPRPRGIATTVDCKTSWMRIDALPCQQRRSSRAIVHLSSIWRTLMLRNSTRQRHGSASLAAFARSFIQINAAR